MFLSACCSLPFIVSWFNMLYSKTYDYWEKKIELTKTHVTSKREIIQPKVDISFLSFLAGLIDGDGYIQAWKKI